MYENEKLNLNDLTAQALMPMVRDLSYALDVAKSEVKQFRAVIQTTREKDQSLTSPPLEPRPIALNDQEIIRIYEKFGMLGLCPILGALYQSGKKIQAIKVAKTCLNCSIREAKDFVESWETRMQELLNDERYGPKF